MSKAEKHTPGHRVTVEQYLAERVQAFRRKYGVSRAAAHAAVLESKPDPVTTHCTECIAAAKTGYIIEGLVVLSMDDYSVNRLFRSVSGYFDVWHKFQSKQVLARVVSASTTKGVMPV